MKRIILCILSIVFIFSVLLNASKNKFISDIIISSKNDDFTDYGIRKIIYAESFYLNQLLGNEFPNTIIKVNIIESLDLIKFEIDSKKKILTVYLNYKLFLEGENSFTKNLLIYMLLTEYPHQSYDSLNGSWIAEGCWAFVRNNLDRSVSEKQDFLFAKMLLSNGSHLSAEAIINFDVELVDGLFELYYFEVSAILISAIMDLPHGKDVMNDYINRIPLTLVNKYIFFLSVLTKYGYDSSQINEVLNSKIRKITLVDRQSQEQINSEIEEYLLEVERNKIPLGKRYNIYFSVLEEHRSMLKSIWPELDSFLNKEYPMKF